jgi:hypothetical protein
MKPFLSLLLPIIFCASLLTSIVLATEKLEVYELSFWTKDSANVESDDRVIGMATHPCGVVAVARVTAIPALESDPTLEPERVVEFSPEGKVLRRWATPVDSVPIGIEDDRLSIEIYQSKTIRLWIGIDGSIIAEEIQIATVEPTQQDCDNLATEFGKSDYANCWLYRDLGNDEPRILAFEGVCT